MDVLRLSQDVQPRAAEVSEYEPVGQVVHQTWAAEDLNFPGGQAAHETSLVSVPAGQVEEGS